MGFGWRGCVVASLLVSGAALGQDWHGEAFRAAGRADRGVQTLAVDGGLAVTLAEAREVRVDAFPLADGSRVTLELKRFEPFTGDGRIVVMTSEGEAELGPVQSTFWTGILSEDPTARVYLAVSDERIDGYILTDDRTWIITSGPATETLPTVIYDLRTIPEDLVKVSGGGCNALTAPGTPVLGEASGFGGDRGAPCRIVTLAIDTDYETTTGINGNPAAAADYLTRLVAAVSVIYQRDLNVNLQIPYMRLWTTPEDPWDQTEMGAQLGQFRDHWASQMRGVRRSLSHFLTFRGLGGGVAWLSVVCNYDWGFGLSSGVGGGFPYPLRDRNDGNWPIFVTAHELGHNFGSGHTHDSYDPVIDGCGNGDCSQASQGTIMSYCHGCEGGMRNITLGFGPRVIERIHQYLDTVPSSCGMTGSLMILRQPQSVAVRRGRPFTLTAAATGPGVPQFRWTRNGVAISGGTNGTFTIASATPNHAGVYVAEAFTPCATRQSTTATVTVVCKADFNADGFVDFFDYDAYVSCFEGAGCPLNEDGDMNNDGFVDFFDFDNFVDRFETNPCGA
jgi:hypothetical protein